MDPLKRKGLNLYALMAIFGLGISQLGSYLINTNLPIHRSVEIFSFLHFTHVRNMGGVFGALQGKGWIFTILSFIFLALLTRYIIRDTNLKLFEYVCCGLILGGGLSNIVDRLIYGSVIDFIDVKGIPGWDYVFNTADTLIHLGIWPWLLLGFIQQKKESDSESIN